jgi:hypothetical protein
MNCEGWHSSRRALSAGALLVLAGCAGREARREEGVAARRAERARSDQSEEPLAIRIDRTLIYKAQWSRADDLAVSLEPLVASLYGPGARVMAHGPSNKLFVYIPSPREREAAGQRGIPGAGQRGGAVAPRSQTGPLPGATPQPGTQPQHIAAPGILLVLTGLIVPFVGVSPSRFRRAR